MAYKTLYRTYRPKSFSDVAGQSPIVRTLDNALKNNKIAHAYLFSGPRGTGKTTMARLFAKALNCDHGIGHQCNECSNCLEIDEGIHPDVIEIDAASNNGIDQVRDLIEKVNYLPIKGKYKVYIIDEVHNMSDSAFNALLKTLEEPPEHVVFILATTEPYSVLPTIISRCQRYDFAKISDEDIESKLIEVLKKEKVSYELDAVKAITVLSDGGLRDALSMLDQILAFNNNHLVADDVYMLFGLASKEDKIDFLKTIESGDAVLAISKLDNFAQLGVDFKRFILDLLEILKDVLIYKKDKNNEHLLSLRQEEVASIASLFKVKEINYMISELIKVQGQLKFVSNIKTLLELVVLNLVATYDEETTEAEEVKVIKPTSNVEVKKEVKSEEKFKDIVVEEKVVEEVEKEEPQAPKVNETTKSEPIKEENNDAETPDWLFDDLETKDLSIEHDPSKEKNILEDEDIIELMVNGNKAERQELDKSWDKLASFLTDPIIGGVAALLKDGHPFILTQHVLILLYDYPRLPNLVNLVINQDKISSVLSKIIKRNIKVYAITRSESVRLRKAFFDLQQIGQLPKPNLNNFNIEKLRSN